MALAFARIRAAAEDDRCPALTCCVARAFALAAWARSLIGYFRELGRPNFEAGSLLRAFALSLLMPIPIPSRCAVLLDSAETADAQLRQVARRSAEKRQHHPASVHRAW